MTKLYNTKSETYTSKAPIFSVQTDNVGTRTQHPESDTFPQLHVRNPPPATKQIIFKIALNYT